MTTLSISAAFLLFPVFQVPVGAMLPSMWGFLKHPVTVTANINLNLVFLTALGLLSRLWGLTHPRAVV